MDKEVNKDVDKITNMDTQQSTENTVELSDQKVSLDASDTSTDLNNFGDEKELVTKSVKEHKKHIYRGKQHFFTGILKLEHEIKVLRLQNEQLIKEKESLQKLQEEKKEKIKVLTSEVNEKNDIEDEDQISKEKV